jgi:hypothetical protein
MRLDAPGSWPFAPLLDLRRGSERSADRFGVIVRVELTLAAPKDWRVRHFLTIGCAPMNSPHAQPRSSLGAIDCERMLGGLHMIQNLHCRSFNEFLAVPRA